MWIITYLVCLDTDFLYPWLGVSGNNLYDLLQSSKLRQGVSITMCMFYQCGISLVSNVYIQLFIRSVFYTVLKSIPLGSIKRRPVLSWEETGQSQKPPTTSRRLMPGLPTSTYTCMYIFACIKANWDFIIHLLRSSHVTAAYIKRSGLTQVMSCGVNAKVLTEKNLYSVQSRAVVK